MPRHALLPFCLLFGLVLLVLGTGCHRTVTYPHAPASVGETLS